MNRITLIYFIVLLFSSCTNKKGEETSNQQRIPNLMPSTVVEFDTTGAYISPTDLFRDNSDFSSSSFQTTSVKFQGNRSISYSLSSHPLKNGIDTILLVVEYLHGKAEVDRNGTISILDDMQTATRLLFYLNGTLSFRKAFPVAFYDSTYFPTVRSFNKTYFDASPTKTVIYFWTEETGYGVNYNQSYRKQYQAVGVDKDGLVYDLTGYIHHISDNLDAVRFLSEDRIRASVFPDSRYRNVAVDVIITIDWKTSTTSLEIPGDTTFSVTASPDRYFSKKVALYPLPNNSVKAKEINLRKTTKAQMLRLFAPSTVGKEHIQRDMLYVQFTAINKGWIDYDKMVFEEIISEK